MAEATIDNHAGFIWSVADLLRGDYKQSEYGKVVLPLTVLRRLDCVLEPTKADVLKRAEALRGRVENMEPVLRQVAGQQFYNVSPLDFSRLLADPAQVAGNLRAYIAGFSDGAREVIDKFDFDARQGHRRQHQLPVRPEPGAAPAGRRVHYSHRGGEVHHGQQGGLDPPDVAARTA